MKKSLKVLGFFFLFGSVVNAQKVDFQELTLDNGLHVILHQDKSAPVIITSVMYHVGAKDENPQRTGFAHFFEHLLFEGTKNIGRGEWMKLVSSNGGTNNANTTDDRTYYFEVFPSNNLELGLWMESERLMHPVINQIGVDTQNEVVKEEKRLRYDNQPYGQFLAEIKRHLFKKHPYRWTTIGAMEHLDAATLKEFQEFNAKFYVPNNAVLVVAGDFEFDTAVKWIKQYFGPIKKGANIKRETFVEEPIMETIKATFEDPNIQIPAVFACYRTPSMKTRDARVLDMISTYLSNGKSSKLYKKMVDDEKSALQVGAFSFSQEDYGAYILFAVPIGTNTTESMLTDIDEEINKLQTGLISEKDFQKLQNIYENKFVNNVANVEKVAENLAAFYLLYGDVNLINNEADIYRSITREDIKEVAKKHLNSNQRLVLDYIAPKDNAKN
ncbi:insulinase family protein [Flavobacterium amniphilum]|uniref:M16 family metallopeptidase n=1 Tax=Flavobacterium amniphilum TaxID=1834035 RepID=UPI00202AB8B2|nr:pitrilysin family protein [Flavobacterium amniphilum]MCL9806998.1 insulinase family protein [Flavobacterium amniphilum]